MERVHVNLGPRGYDIAITPRAASSSDGAAFSKFVRTAVPRSSLALIVCDTNTQTHAEAVEATLSGCGLRTGLSVVPAGEGSKCLERLSSLYDALAARNADRHTVIVAVGGGMIGDLAGFAAATYNRGLPLLMIPTTLLAMVDSSVGGKTGINHPLGKNLIGAFHQPRGVWIDLAMLDTLPEREYLSGLAEVVKYGVACDSDFFDYLENNAHLVRDRKSTVLPAVIARCCRLKAEVIEMDEFETTGVRAALNYGHTFAHAIETLDGYRTLLHGEAVAIGMMYAAKLASRLNRISDLITERQRRLLEALWLPAVPHTAFDAEELIAVMRRDKKAVGGALRFILPKRIGEVELVEDVTASLVKAVLQES